MMPNVPSQIRNYGDLKNAVALWADRDDDEFVNQIPNFINFAEKEIYRTLRIPAFEREEFLRIVDGIAYIPPDLLEIKYIMNAETCQFARVTSVEEMDWLRRDKTINKTSFEEGEIVFARAAGRLFFFPKITSVVPNSNIDANGGVVSVQQDPDASSRGAYLINYYTDVPEYVDDADTSVLMTLAPELLLYLALKHSALFVQDDNAVQKWAALGQGVIAELEEQKRKFEYSGSPLVIPNTFWGGQSHNKISYNMVNL